MAPCQKSCQSSLSKCCQNIVKVLTALLTAQSLAEDRPAPLAPFYCLPPLSTACLPPNSRPPTHPFAAGEESSRPERNRRGRRGIFAAGGTTWTRSHGDRGVIPPVRPSARPSVRLAARPPVRPSVRLAGPPRMWCRIGLVPNGRQRMRRGHGSPPPAP